MLKTNIFLPNVHTILRSIISISPSIVVKFNAHARKSHAQKLFIPHTHSHEQLPIGYCYYIICRVYCKICVIFCVLCLI